MLRIIAAGAAALMASNGPASAASGLDGASLSVCHGGVDMPDTFEASLDGELDLLEVDGEDV